jgi:hypothetical protein
MTINDMRLEFFPGLPEDHGTYFFLLDNGLIKEGYFGSFPHPHNNEDVRIADCEDEDFYYVNVVGWFQVIS